MIFCQGMLGLLFLLVVLFPAGAAKDADKVNQGPTCLRGRKLLEKEPDLNENPNVAHNGSITPNFQHTVDFYSNSTSLPRQLRIFRPKAIVGIVYTGRTEKACAYYRDEHQSYSCGWTFDLGVMASPHEHTYTLTGGHTPGEVVGMAWNDARRETFRRLLVWYLDHTYSEGH